MTAGTGYRWIFECKHTDPETNGRLGPPTYFAATHVVIRIPKEIHGKPLQASMEIRQSANRKAWIHRSAFENPSVSIYGRYVVVNSSQETQERHQAVYAGAFPLLAEDQLTICRHIHCAPPANSA
jgi:hypothetical protein